ncbi:toxin-antitoxin system HicB family antitoxin [Crocosphaera sp. UHCC 0190]|nr:toxin-antitoxin system HicB family antitoxin [Crocosphaera sp. UHCC 0190]MEA5509730.1 toxin-antitoxin system HicB family antitoxin [Crocosphaera sp. UHCC 0190]
MRKVSFEMKAFEQLQIHITPELHRKLAIEATENKVSLNGYVSRKLAANS